SSTATSPNGPGSSLSAFFSLPDFAITFVSTASSTGTDFSSQTAAINIYYSGGVGANSDTLLIEVLGDSYVNPTAPAPAFISSNASPSSAGLAANSIIMTSGVLNGNVSLSGTPGTTLGGQLGQTIGTGSMIENDSSVLLPNPSVGPTFNISNPFTFYQ